MGFEIIAVLFVLSGVVCAGVIYFDEFVRGNRHPMKVMNVVWVLTALWGGVFALWAYHRFGRAHAMKMPSMSSMAPMAAMEMSPMTSMSMNSVDCPMWQRTALSTLHCGAGCSLADLIGEWFLFFVPMSLFGGWAVDYVLALFIGILFQYAVISKMGKLTTKQAFMKALKVDFWSLTSWQIGMYGFMGVAIFVFDFQIDRLSWEFWFMMQIAMMCGFVTSYPVNRLLISLGVKK